MIQGCLDGRTADPCTGTPHFLGSSGGSRDDLRCIRIMLEDSGNPQGAEVQG